MQSILLYDPLIMGHHLVYAENFTDWALSRGLKVFFCGYHYQKSLFHRRFADHPRVEFLELDAGLFEHKASFSRMAEEMGETAFYYDRIRPLLFDDDGPAIQVAFLKDLQRLLRPELTLVLYGDEMWSAWEDMVRSGEAFETPTWLWLLYAAGHMYDPWGLNAKDIRHFLAGQRIFQAVATADEYQAGRFDPGGRVLRYVPDPYRRLGGGPEVLTGEETRQLEGLAGFLAGGEEPVLLVPGLLEARKNAKWLLDLAGSRPDLSLVILGRKNLPPGVEEEACAVFDRLAAQGRLFTVFSYVPESFLDAAMANPRVAILPLPYRRHDLSSGIQLMALSHGLPCLVPDNGLMARRTLEHGLGGVFAHESETAFLEAASRLLDCDRSTFAPASSSFMAHFSREAFFAGADRFFGLRPGVGSGEPVAPSNPAEAMVRDSMRRDADLLRLEPEGPDASAWLLQKALLLRQLGRIEDSLACLAKAQTQTQTQTQAGRGARCATRPAYLRAVILEEAGRAREGYALLNGLLLDQAVQPGEPAVTGAPEVVEEADVAAWIDAQSDAFVKRLPPEESHAKVLARLRQDCGEGPLFPALLEVLSDRVWRHIHSGRFDQAERILLAVLEVAPEHGRSLFVLAMNRFIRAMDLKREGHTAEAMAAFETAAAMLDRLLERRPADAECLRSRASVWAQMGRYDESARAFADMAAGGDVEANLHLSDVLRYAGRFDESMAALERGFHLGACTETVRSRKAARIEAERAALAAKQGTGNHAPTS